MLLYLVVEDPLQTHGHGVQDHHRTPVLHLIEVTGLGYWTDDPYFEGVGLLEGHYGQVDDPGDEGGQNILLQEENTDPISSNSPSVLQLMNDLLHRQTLHRPEVHCLHVLPLHVLLGAHLELDWVRRMLLDNVLHLVNKEAVELLCYFLRSG